MAMSSAVLPPSLCARSLDVEGNGAIKKAAVCASPQLSLFSTAAAAADGLRLPVAHRKIGGRPSRRTRGRGHCLLPFRAFAQLSTTGDSLHDDESESRAMPSGRSGDRKPGPELGSSENSEWTGEGRIGDGQGVESESESASSSSSESLFTLFSAAPMVIYPLIAAADGPGYSLASYYTSLGLFVISVPGIWSLVKRSTKSKIVKKTFSLPGPKAGEESKNPTVVAGEITSSLSRNNFKIADRGETVTFEGLMLPSRGQAAFLSFCTAVSLACVALVLSITVPDVGGNWYYLTVLSPLAGFYYWTKASRKEQIKVKMVIEDDESSTDVIIQGDDEQIDRLRRELGLMEKGMVYVKGLLEN